MERRGGVAAAHQRRDFRQRHPASSRRGRVARQRAAASRAVRAQSGRRLSQHHRRPHPRLQRRHGPHPRLLVARGADGAVRAGALPGSVTPRRLHRRASPRTDDDQPRDLAAPQGRTRLSGSIESVHLLDGDPEILEGTVIDITDRKLAENALRESEERYRLLVERMREGLVQAGNDGVLQFVNDRFCEMVGYSREELIGLQGELLLAYPEDVALMREKTRLRMRHIADQYEMRVRRKDGTVVWLEIGGAPVVDAAGNVVGSIGVHNDVTERRMAEEALRESEARYRLMAENSTDMISRTSNRGIILYASDASPPPPRLRAVGAGRPLVLRFHLRGRSRRSSLPLVADPRIRADDVRLSRREKGRLAGLVRDDQPQRARRAQRQDSRDRRRLARHHRAQDGSKSRSSIRPITTR